MSGKILITRPVSEAAETAASIRALGRESLAEPLLDVQTLDFAVPDSFDALIFTSANGVRACSSMLYVKGCPVFCVGERTSDAARAAGFSVVTCAGATVAALEKWLNETGLLAGETVFYPSGFDISKEIEIIKARIVRVPVYRAVPVSALSPACLDSLRSGDIEAALFFSARTAAVFCDLLERHGCTQSAASIKALCLSDSVVKSLRRLTFGDVRVANRPDQSSLLALIDPPPVDEPEPKALQ